ncbi:MAG: flagellar export chaperone FliS [Burkholderiaceae bacterium]
MQGANLVTQLVGLLFDALLQSIAARGAMERGETAVKGAAISKAVRLIEEGLKAGLNLEQGGEIALNLRGLYDYSVQRLTHANLRNDAEALQEVTQLMEPLATAWKQIGGTVNPASAPTMSMEA